MPFAPAMRHISAPRQTWPPSAITPPTPLVKFNLELMHFELSIYYRETFVNAR